MAILAHPDDESFGNGATFARYAVEGVEITLVTATRRERSWRDQPDGLHSESLRDGRTPPTGAHPVGPRVCPGVTHFDPRP